MHTPDVNRTVRRRRLETLREELRQRLPDMEPDVLDAPESDRSRIGRLSRMDALQRRALEAEARRRCRAQLQRVEAALRRMEGDDYGECITCGEPIATGRLDVDPAATQCIRCAERAEGLRRDA